MTKVEIPGTWIKIGWIAPAKWILVFLILILMAEPSSAAWWNTSWAKKVDNQIADGARPYQISLNLSNATGTNNATWVFGNGSFNINFTDIRFTLDDATVLPHWIEDNATGKVWVNVTANGTVNMYYGNPSATSTSNGNATFQFFDDFNDGVIDPSKWSNSTSGTGSYVNESGGEARLHTNNIASATADLNSTKTYGPSVAIRIRARLSINQTYDYKGLGFIDAPISTVPTGAGAANGTYFRSNGTSFKAISKNPTGSQSSGNLTPYPTSYSTLEIEWLTSKVNFYINNTYKTSQTTGVPLVSITPRFSLKTDTTAPTNPLDIYVDWVFVRRHESPGPVWATWGAEQDASVCGILDVDGGVYTLINDVSSSGTCFTVGAHNITLDGNGFNISYGSTTAGYGINNSAGYDNITIKNFNKISLNNPTATTSYGIYTSGMINSYVSGNTISSNKSIGFYLSLSSNNTVTNNTISSNTSYGLYLTSSSNNTVTNNTISSNTSIGFYLSSSSNNTVTNNTISSNTGYGLYLTSNLNNFANNIVRSESGVAIEVWSVSGNKFRNDSFVSSTNIDYQYL